MSKPPPSKNQPPPTVSKASRDLTIAERVRSLKQAEQKQAVDEFETRYTTWKNSEAGVALTEYLTVKESSLNGKK